uniref:Peroxisomal membrane protein n=1 Tax=Strongyloides papillosus TaxID=174720 RepID=A0A0N5BSX6_STREA
MATPAATVVAETIPKLPLMKRIGKRVTEYLIQLKNDYKGSLEDAIADSKAKPHKALALVSFSSFAVYAFVTNPSVRDFRNTMAQKRIKMAMIPPSIHNPVTVNAINEREQLWIQNRLRFIDCFLFTLVVRTTYDSTLRSSESQDSNLRDWYFNEIFKNIVDIGAFNRFFYLEKAMEDCDINDQ